MKERIEYTLSSYFSASSSEEYKDPLTGIRKSLQEYKIEIYEQFDEKFPEDPPFTIQRIAELLLKPRNYYTERDPQKFLFALERSLSVQSTQKEYPENDLKTELKNVNGVSRGGNDETDGASGIVLTPINWVVDTGTPPPDDLEGKEDREEEEGKVTKKQKQEHNDETEAENDNDDKK